MTARKQTETEHQGRGMCTWCGHRHSSERCDDTAKVAVGPSGGPGRAVPTKITICLCRRPT